VSSPHAELFDNFKNLKELEIALNGISRMDLACQSFPSLQVVDLSYNSLSDQAILALGILPALKELHLSGNSLVLLPAEMSRPHHPEPNKSEHVEGVIVRYPRLEKLWLDDNRLTDLSTFAVLAGLKRCAVRNAHSTHCSHHYALDVIEPVHIVL
jgi:Leucine-rich repeat (LRR) protein